MFSEVARHHKQHNSTHPSHLLPQFFHEEISSDDTSNASLNVQPSSVQNASFRARTERTSQHARPLPDTAALPQQLPMYAACVPSAQSSEHMLRRKTPNGTLAAGYDGSPGEWTKRSHAVKQSSTSTFCSSPERPAKTFKEGLLHPSDRTRGSWVGGQSHSQINHGDAPGGMLQDSTMADDIKSSHRWGSTVPPGGMDSVLNQSSNFHHSYKYAGSQHVPTVLQPMWPPCLGPTSIHDPGPYGPYWPGGAFEPYRPAPLQDPRFRNTQGKHQTVHSSQIWPAVKTYGQWLQTHGSLQKFEASSHLIPSPQPPRSKREGFMPLEIASGSSRKRNTLLSSQILPTPQQQIERPSFQSNGRSPYLEHTTPLSSETSFEEHFGNFSVATSPFPQSAASSNSPSQFKEKVLVWAHRIYGNLLASVDQARRKSLSEQRSATVHTHVNLHPHPPRRPYPSWSSGQSRDMRSFPFPGGLADRLPKSDDDDNLDRTLNHDDQDSSEDNAIFSSSSSTVPQFQSKSQAKHGWLLRNGSPKSYPPVAPPSYVPPQIASDLQTNSPSAAAMYAVEMLSRLCQESGFAWIDGMLLSGCLFYGLGEYTTALKWYQKVLQRDPSNVEAISNLAATYLALDAREDAEKYWFHSIKLRPSYFEAIEHLIGLLHESHRGQEAVKLIEYVEQALRSDRDANEAHAQSETPSKGPSASLNYLRASPESANQDLSASGYAISPMDNGRMLALIHGKGNMLYQLGDNSGAAQAFENAILIGAGRRHLGIQGLIKNIIGVLSQPSQPTTRPGPYEKSGAGEPILLTPDMALETSHLVFPPHGLLPGLAYVPDGFGQKAAVSIVSNSLLSLAKIYQDGMSSSGATATTPRATSGVQEILALYYLSLSLQPSPSTANNVGILLASVQQSTRSKSVPRLKSMQPTSIPGVVQGSGVALALAYYDYGLKLDSRHAHLYTNLGSLFKDIGQLQAAIKMYEKAVECDGTFDIALANLANAVKDQGRVSDAIVYYKRAVISNPEFAEAVCGLANALNSVCSWKGRGGTRLLGGRRDRWHVDQQGDLYDCRTSTAAGPGWIERVVAIVERQLEDGEGWGRGVLRIVGLHHMFSTVGMACFGNAGDSKTQTRLKSAIEAWAGDKWEGAKVVRLIERATKSLIRQIYLLQHVDKRPVPPNLRLRPQLPTALAVPSAPTVLPFHTFTCPLTAKQIRQISQRNGLRVSCSTLRAPWLPAQVYEPPNPPNPHLNVGYVSSDFNNHPLAHLMQSVFGFHDQTRVKAFCYATTASDGSIHRQQIEREAPMFHDASSWSLDRLVGRIVADGIHILVNLNGYTRGAKNEVFAARPAPIQMSFMGFAGTLGAEWCDYLLADSVAIPPQTLRPWRGNLGVMDQTNDGNNDADQEDWVYGENIIFTKETFFCCDHRQSAPDAREAQMTWPEEQRRRWKMRKELFPNIADDAVILGNFNQLYKIEPTTFRTWLRILSRVPKAVLWLLRFPDLGEEHLKETALRWVGTEVASRIIFTDVAPKHQHISRARICDLFLDTPECNAHTTAADVLWSGTPLLTFPRHEYKMCSRMAASILTGALPQNDEGEKAAKDLICDSDEAYEDQAVELSSDLSYSIDSNQKGLGEGRLIELRILLYNSRWTSALFDTRRWVRDLESAYSEAWRKWVAGEGGDIWL